MADSAVAITAGTGTPIRVLTGLGAASADQQVMTLADSAGNLLGTPGAPFPALTPGAVTANGSFTAVDAVVAAPVGDGTLISGTSTAGSIVSLAVPDAMSGWVMLVKGFAASQTTMTIYSEASMNSTNGIDGDWVEVKGRRTGTAPGTESVVYAFQSNGYYRGNAAGFTYLRGRALGSFAAGVTLSIRVSHGTGPTFLNSGIPAGSSQIGTVALAAGANTVGNVKVTDGTNTSTVKAASTAALAADTAQVVALHPSSPVPAGANTIGNVGGASAVVAAGSLGALNATYEGVIDCALYSTVRVSISGTWAGTVTFQISNDGTNWFSRGLNTSLGAYVATASSNNAWSGEIGGRYFRVLMSAYTSGTAVPTIVYSTAAAVAQAPVLSTGANTIGTVGIGATTQSASFYTSTATNAATVAKSTVGSLQALVISNTGAAVQYVKVYNAASVTLGTTAAVIDIPVAATSVVSLPLGANGLRFTSGIAYAVTGAAGATNNTAGAGGVLVAVTYV